jgi:glutathione peroxidase
MPTNTTLSQSTVYQFTAYDLAGNPVNLSDYEGKVLLIVNTASQCAFTPQLRALEEIYQAFRDQGFAVLAFPSNDFGEQEPLNGSGIEQFCVDTYHTSFPIFDKIHVRGEQAAPLFKFLADKRRNGKTNLAPFWNFHKYIIDRKGKLRHHFWSFISPNSFFVKRAIQKLL